MDHTTTAINNTANRAVNLFYNGKKKEALELLVELRSKHPQLLSIKRLMGNLSSQAGHEVPFSKRFADELANCLDEHLGNPRGLLVTAGHVLLNDGDFIKVLNKLATERTVINSATLQSGLFLPVTENTLLISMLRNVLLINKLYESALTNYRKHLLSCMAEFGTRFELSSDADKVFCSAMAMQCWINEYVFFVEDNEYNLLDRLRNEAEQYLEGWATMDNRIESVLLTIAMYQPLHELKLPPTICDSPESRWPASLQPLIAETCRHYEETRIREEISSIGNIEDKVSLAVKKQYEENPYPRWLPFSYMEKNSFGNWIATRHPNFTPPDFLQKPIRLLVAGCGTGHEVFSADAQWLTSQILAVDLSRSSLAYATRVMRELGTGGNIEFRQADILAMDNLPKQYSEFDVISCGGVLHHMEDPMQGWRILADQLRPGGVMRVALYSELGRRHIATARKLIADNKIPSNPHNIRHFRHQIFSSTYPELSVLCGYPGMYSTSTCRDLLFHVQEHRFHLERIKEMISELNLRFIGFGQIERSIQDYNQMFPNDPHMTSLDNWSFFEHKYPDTFSSMYLMLLQKPETPTTAQ